MMGLRPRGSRRKVLLLGVLVEQYPEMRREVPGRRRALSKTVRRVSEVVWLVGGTLLLGSSSGAGRVRPILWDTAGLLLTNGLSLRALSLHLPVGSFLRSPLGFLSGFG